MNDPLSQIFFALADPTRRAILARLAIGDASADELAESFSITGSAMIKHLKVLDRAGLISQIRDAQWRRCRIDADGLRDVADWVDCYRQFWDANLDRLEFFLRYQQQELGENT